MRVPTTVAKESDMSQQGKGTLSVVPDSEEIPQTEVVEDVFSEEEILWAAEQAVQRIDDPKFTTEVIISFSEKETALRAELERLVIEEREYQEQLRIAEIERQKAQEEHQERMMLDRLLKAVQKVKAVDIHASPERQPIRVNLREILEGMVQRQATPLHEVLRHELYIGDLVCEFVEGFGLPSVMDHVRRQVEGFLPTDYTIEQWMVSLRGELIYALQKCESSDHPGSGRHVGDLHGHLEDLRKALKHIDIDADDHESISPYFLYGKKGGLLRDAIKSWILMKNEREVYVTYDFDARPLTFAALGPAKPKGPPPEIRAKQAERKARDRTARADRKGSSNKIDGKKKGKK